MDHHDHEPGGHGHDHGEHGHGRGDHGAEGGHGLPHEPAPPGPRFTLPDPGTAVRGVALGGVAVALLAGAVGSVQKAGWLASPVAALFGLGSFLAAWASLIHLTGGEKFDDHPWV